MFKKNYRQHAFTLIELLIVIAIICILAAILFPVFMSARAKARQATCASNLKQIILGTLQYVQDYDETYPLVEYQSPAGINEIDANQGSSATMLYTVFDALAPYIKSTDVLHCPDVSALDTHGYLANHPRAWDYGYNHSLFGGEFPQWDSGLPMFIGVAYTSQIVSPATQIMYGDFFYPNDTVLTPYTGYTSWISPQTWYEGRPVSFYPSMGFPVGGPAAPMNNGHGHTCVDGPLGKWPDDDQTWSWEVPAPRHINYSSNFAYADGHVKLRPILQVFAHGCGDPLSEFCNGN